MLANINHYDYNKMVHLISAQKWFNSILGQPPSAYVMYKFYEYPDHDTPISQPTTSPDFDNIQHYEVIMGSSLHSYLKEDVCVSMCLCGYVSVCLSVCLFRSLVYYMCSVHVYVSVLVSCYTVSCTCTCICSLLPTLVRNNHHSHELTTSQIIHI